MFELVCLYDFGDFGSSLPELFYEKRFVKIFAKFTVILRSFDSGLFSI